jgi:hypothetical protein
VRALAYICGMLPAKYLRGVPTDPFEGCPGVFAADHYKQAGAYRYIASYADGLRWKDRIFALLARQGQPETPGDWELHHVIEGQHFADIDFTGRLQAMYDEELPVVLLHQGEHRAYNRLLHIKQTTELFRQVLPKDQVQRAQEAAVAATDRNRWPELRRRVDDLLRLYGAAYAGDPVLTGIARNVLNDARALLT